MSQTAPQFAPPAEPVPFVPDPAAELPDGAEVVVVGGGMMGASAAYRLALAGMRPLVIEANAPAWGASGRNAGMALAGLGGHFPRVDRLVREAGGHSIAEYTTRSLDLLEELHADLPGGIEWERSGSLDLFTTEGQDAHGRALGEQQAAGGVEVSVVGGADLRELAPALDRRVAQSAKWTPRDGKLNPFRLVYRLLEAATLNGARVVTGVRVDELLVRSGRAAGVATSHGPVSAGTVLLATNAWTPALVPSIAANLTPIREHVMVTEPLPPLLGPGFETNQCNEYWRQMRTGEVLIGGYAIADLGMGIGCYAMDVSPRIPPLLAQLLARLHPALRDVRVVRAWSGLLDFASQEVPMAGPLPAADGTPMPGAFLACGLTGHGHPYAPILGLLLSELISSGAPRTLPLAPFDPARYVGAMQDPTWLGPFRGDEVPVDQAKMKR
ncbi:MAG: FAD-binding oxidoreductase [Chloroflexota bacterium]